MENRFCGLYPVLARTAYLAAVLLFVLWFLKKISFIVLFFLFAGILVMALNPPVRWLEARRTPRVLATALVCLVGLGVAGGLGWLVAPRIAEQAAQLWSSLPDYLASLSDKVSSLLPNSPRVQELLRMDSRTAGKLLSSLPTVLGGMLAYTGSIFAFLALLVLFASLVIYMLARPRPLLTGLFTAIPERFRDPTARALAKSSSMVQAWVFSNIIVGGVEAVASWLFLTWMDVPGATVWAALALFSELIPKLGAYIMSVPPVLMALAVDPITAAWTAIFYVLLIEITGDTISPWIRGEQMALHPAFLILTLLAMTSAFGLVGALVSTPLAGVLMAFYEEFYLVRQPEDERMEERVEAVVNRNTEWGKGRGA